MTTETTPASTVRAVGSNLALGLVNNLVMRFGSLLLGVVLARLLVPEDFGLFAVALTIQAVLASLTDLGLTAYLVRADDARSRASTVLTMGLLVGLLLAGLMAAVASPLASLMNSPDATDVIRVLSFTLVLTGVGSVPTALLQRRFQQGRQLAADLSSFVINAATALLLIEAGMGAMSLAWARVLGQLVAVVLLFALSHHLPVPGWNGSVARDAYRFGVHLVGANVLSWVLLNMDYVLVGHTYGAAALGVYVLAFNIASWPTQALSQALRAVALPAFARIQGTDPGTRTRVLGIAGALALAASMPLGALLGALAQPVVLAVYGEKWGAAAGPLAALAAFGAVRPVFDLLATYLTARARTRAVFGVQVLWAACLFPALLIGIHMWGPTGAGAAHLAVALFVVLPVYLLVLRREGIEVVAVVARAGRPALVAALAGAIAASALLLPGSPWLAVLGGGGVAGFFYIGAMARWLRRTVGALSATDEAEGIDTPGDDSPPPVCVDRPPIDWSDRVPAMPGPARAPTA